jgi:hypothetical protein
MLSAPYRRVSFCLVQQDTTISDCRMLPRYSVFVQSKSHGSGQLFQTETLDWRAEGNLRRVDTISGGNETRVWRATQ